MGEVVQFRARGAMLDRPVAPLLDRPGGPALDRPRGPLLDRRARLESALAQSRRMTAYFGPERWRQWCERRGLVVEDDGSGPVAYLPPDLPPPRPYRLGAGE